MELGVTSMLYIAGVYFKFSIKYVLIIKIRKNNFIITIL